MKKVNNIMSLAATLLVLSACSGKSGPDPILADVSLATFVDEMTNPYFPLPKGAAWTYEGTTGKGTERIEIEVSSSTREIEGITATVVTDNAYLDGVLIESTTDWYAQDTDGNVWYLGEDTCVFEDGACVDKEGSWLYGVDGALPGIAMRGTPTVDEQPYYQEYYVDHAEDVGEVVALNESVTTPAGSFTDCVKTHDTSTLDSSLEEHKFFCRGIGFVMEPEANLELIAYSGL